MEVGIHALQPTNVGLPDIGDRLIAGITLGQAIGQSRDTGHQKATISRL